MSEPNDSKAVAYLRRSRVDDTRTGTVGYVVLGPETAVAFAESRGSILAALADREWHVEKELAGFGGDGAGWGPLDEHSGPVASPARLSGP